MGKSIPLRFEDLATFEVATRSPAVSTGEVVATWAEAEANARVNYVRQSSRRLNPETSRVTETVTKLMLPSGLLADGSTLAPESHRVSSITLKDGSALTGPWDIREVVTRRDAKRRPRYISVTLEGGSDG